MKPYVLRFVFRYITTLSEVFRKEGRRLVPD